MVQVVTSQATSSKLCNNLKPIADKHSAVPSASTCRGQYRSRNNPKSLTLSNVTILDPCFFICLIPSRTNPWIRLVDSGAALEMTSEDMPPAAER
jgi:hypothetical protein